MKSLLDPVGLAWASWVGLLVGVVGSAVSFIGLVLTFREARAAKRASEATRQEVEKVISITRSRARLSALSSAVSQADLLGMRIDKDGLKSGRDAFTAFRRSVKEALAILALSAGGNPVDAQQVDESLAQIGRLMVEKVEDKARREQMHVALEKVSAFLIAQEARAKTEDLT